MSKLITGFFLISLFVIKAAEPLPLSKEYWKSDAFRKAFNGSYRINARIEPFVDTKERDLLVAVQALMEKGERKSAISKLKASSLSSSSAAVMFNIANIAFETGDLELAKTQYSSAIKTFPTFLRAQQNLAFVHAREGDYDKAFPYLLEVIKLGSQDGSVMGLLGYCYQQKENFTSALQAFKNAQLTEPENIEWKIGEAYCYDSLGENAKALNLYESIVKKKPDEKQYMLLLINLYQRTGATKEAMVNLELLRRKGSLDISNKILLGALHLNEGSSVIGADVIREVLNSDQLTDGNIAMNAVGFAIGNNELDLAAEFHGLIKPELVKKHTLGNRYNRQQAQILILQDKELGKAVELLTVMIAVDPLDADSLYLLAQYEASHKLEERALLHFQQAYVGNGKRKNSSLLERGKLLVKLQRYQEALKDLSAYQIHAEGSQIEQLRTYISAVKSLQKSSQ
ncbi:MAG: tetratricopeptide (TPR) repeat protein [Cryomorphaceae bacterium]|jgi:tetratricopeptide (TPR) repeat protein